VELTPDQLLRRVAGESLPFATTAEITPGEEPLAQERAQEAVDFGTGMRFPGYNVYALGAPQTDKRTLVFERLSALAQDQPVPDDWCYVENFDEPARPYWIRLPGGVGRRLRHDMQGFVSNVRSMVPAALKSEDFQRASQALAGSLQERQSSDTEALEQQAKQLGLTMLPTPNGFVFAPVKDGKVMEQDAFLALDEKERQQIQEAIATMTNRLAERLRDYPEYERKLLEAQRELARETTNKVIAKLIAPLRQHYQTNDKLMLFLAAVQRELAENFDRILAVEQPARRAPFMMPTNPETFFERFRINLIVDAGDGKGAPVLYESNPSLDNLVGKLELKMEFGNPVTDHNLIRAGALQRANGGYLLLDAERLVQKPFAWEALKRALSDRCVRIESVSQLVNLTYSVSLEPEAIPLDLKIVLLGSRYLYHLLRQFDPDFGELFKVVADFDDDVDFDDEHVHEYSELIAKLVIETGIRHLDAGAVGRVLEYSSRLVEDRERLSTHIGDIRDLLQEADYVAARDDAKLIQRAHVEEAIDKRIYRLDRFRELVLENVTRGLILVETSGAKVGQINGLSVLRMGQVQFGQPMRITATARLGRGELIDIERESHLGGNIHSKAVMIVSSFLGSRYAREQPLSLHASLVFEQSYGGVEGDSASIAEVCALLSAITERPLKQCLAVTGSMDQHGTSQAIGGVNEKIEGFFDICNALGLTGEQGVIIPASNQAHLMLRQDVVDAVTNGRFHVYTMETVDDAIELLFAAEGQARVDRAEIDAAVRQRVAALHEMRRRAVQGEEQHDGG